MSNDNELRWITEEVFASDQYLGRVKTIDLGSRHHPVATIFYCRDCGRVFGSRIPSQGVNGYWYYGTECVDHGDGSLLSKYDELESIPEALATYEIMVSANIKGPYNPLEQ